jgi:hypothetical protein
LTCRYADSGKKAGSATVGSPLTTARQSRSMRTRNAGSDADGRADVWGSVPGSTVVLVVVAGGAVDVVVVVGAAVDVVAGGAAARWAADEQPASTIAIATRRLTTGD